MAADFAESQGGNHTCDAQICTVSVKVSAEQQVGLISDAGRDRKAGITEAMVHDAYRRYTGSNQGIAVGTYKVGHTAD